MLKGTASLHLQKIEVQKRTDGDGMENTETPDNSESSKSSTGDSCFSNRYNLIDRLIYRPKDLNETSFVPPSIQGQIVHLMPKTVTPVKKEGNYAVALSGREPKFVPYEPYKAAVKPIIPIERKKKKKSVRATAVHNAYKNENCDENEKHKSQISGYNDATGCKISNVGCSVQNNDGVQKFVDSESEHKLLEELKRLKEENEQLENQLKFQAQVNGELKNLLVAAMGEDLETRVHLLTEDKLQLARALLSSAQKLTTHQEQTEYLAGQCEVWRSKFLASSLMVEELAKWKAALCHKASELQENIKKLLSERSDVRESLIATYRELALLCDKFDLTEMKGGKRQSGLKSSNIIDLASINEELCLNLRIQLLGDIPDSLKKLDLNGLEGLTHNEHQAEQLLLHPLAFLSQPDAACTAVVDAAVALGAGQMYTPPAPACCSHCSGKIKLI